MAEVSLVKLRKKRNVTGSYWWWCGKSTLVQVLAWCCQASSVTPCGVTRPQWVKWHWEWWFHDNTLNNRTISIPMHVRHAHKWHSDRFQYFQWLMRSLRYKADSKFAPSQWETSLQSNAVSQWLDASIESALYFIWWHETTNTNCIMIIHEISQTVFVHTLLSACRTVLLNIPRPIIFRCIDSAETTC